MKVALLTKTLYILIILSLISCDIKTAKITTVEGIWTSFESMDDNTPRITLAFQDTNLLWLSGAGNEMNLLSYRIDKESIYFFDQLDGYWQPSIYQPGKIERINDSIIWLSTTPSEVEILERSKDSIDRKAFESMSKDDLKGFGTPWYRKE
jgi:hypothetical protein